MATTDRPWDLNASLRELRTNKNTISSGRCEHAVRVAICNGGITIEGTNYAKDFGVYLVSAGFKSVDTKSFEAGDVAVIQGFVSGKTSETLIKREGKLDLYQKIGNNDYIQYPAGIKSKPPALYYKSNSVYKLMPHTAGHVAMYDGTKWISDFEQRQPDSPYPGQEYRDVWPNFKIYRYQGPIVLTLEAAVIKIAADLGVPLAPTVKNGIAIAVIFLNGGNAVRSLIAADPAIPWDLLLDPLVCWHLRLIPKERFGLPHKEEDYVQTYLRGIDFHSPVNVVQLQPRIQLSRHQSVRSIPTVPICNIGDNRIHYQKPFVFFTKPGVSPMSTGTSFPNSQFLKFEVKGLISALASTSAGMRFGMNPAEMDIVREGGGVQYLLCSGDVQNSLRLVQAGSPKSRTVARYTAPALPNWLKQ